jgi:glycosyltransferase involved in cell wall biosynthesis
VDSKAFNVTGDPMDQELISVIIPCYNQAQFLDEAIESALAQSYRRVEVIVVDDGSTDDTATVAARYPDVRYIHQANRGLAAARNTGIRHSRGGYLAFLDADDLLLPTALARGWDWLRAHPDHAFVSGHYRFRCAGGVRLAPRLHPAESDPYGAMLRRNHITMHGSVLYRRAAIIDVDGFDSSLRACEDYDLYLRLARLFPFGRHNGVVAEYRQHGANMTRDAALMLKSAEAVLWKQRAYVLDHPHYRRAYAIGLRFWRDLYGAQLMESILSDLRSHQWRRAAHRFGVLMHHGPLGIATRIPHRILWRFARALRSRWRFRSGRRIHEIDFGALRSVTPVSREFGFDRGQPVDRYYIERFLADCADDIRGHVLEVGDDAYTRAFGGANVTESDVLHVTHGNPAATIVADLAHAEQIPSDAFDCIVLTQTLHLIYDLPAAVRTIYRTLHPGGVILATVPGISQISSDRWKESWYWSLTPLSTKRLFAEIFGDGNITIGVHGNVLVATAFLQGLAATELTHAELAAYDPQYPVVITVRAVKPLPLATNA